MESSGPKAEENEKNLCVRVCLHNTTKVVCLFAPHQKIIAFFHFFHFSCPLHPLGLRCSRRQPWPPPAPSRVEVKSISPDGLTMEFDLIGTCAPIANMMRRVMMEEVPPGLCSGWRWAQFYEVETFLRFFFSRLGPPLGDRPFAKGRPTAESGLGVVNESTFVDAWVGLVMVHGCQKSVFSPMSTHFCRETSNFPLFFLELNVLRRQNFFPFT